MKIAGSLVYSQSIMLRRILLLVILSGAPGMLLYAYLHFSETGLFPSLSRNTGGFLISALVGIAIGTSLYFTNKGLDRWITWRNHFAARFLVGFGAQFCVAVGLCLILSTIIMQAEIPHMLWNGFSPRDTDLMSKTFILMLVSVFVYSVIYALLYSYQHYAVAQLETLQGERKQLELQFEALKSQISPHYLFNSLNTISSLIFKDAQSAEQFIRRLAQTYQYILSTQNKPYVLLREEVEFVQSYYYLLRIRFQQQLTVDINLPSGIMNTKIPPLTLQMLVENAVKHNNLATDKKLFIYITAQDNTYLKVINTKTGNQFNISSFNVGLENIKRRYKFFTDKKIEIKDEEKFMVSLPVIHNKQKEQLEQRFSA